MMEQESGRRQIRKNQGNPFYQKFQGKIGKSMVNQVKLGKNQGNYHNFVLIIARKGTQ